MGCSKNLVDSEHLAARAAALGWEIVFDSNNTDARTVVINTCGFVGDAKQESIDMILDFAAARERGEIDRLYVIGCLSERYADELRAEIPEVDSFFGARGLDDIFNELVGLKPGEGADSSLASRVISTPPHYAYLKISEGCDRRCGFCAIPLIRGPHTSVPIENLVAEARELAAGGVKELIVIAQDTTYYGLDIYGERRLAELLRQLAAIDGIEWIRLHYAYPAGFPQDVIDLMRTEPKICKYLDIPLQHIADGQLRSMKRGLGGNGTRELVARLRAEIPGLAIRTTMLVGYPGETEADFEELLAFVREARFERLGVFPYSEEEGTFSASNLSDDVPEEVKNLRVERLMEAQAAISASLNAARVGTTERVIVDRIEDNHLVCRGRHDSPEVDGEILVARGTGDGVADPVSPNTPIAPAAPVSPIAPGDFIDVEITSANEYDLFAKTILNS
jgi:ribosomal protein S12 methylthiotransferase